MATLFQGRGGVAWLDTWHHNLSLHTFSVRRPNWICEAKGASFRFWEAKLIICTAGLRLCEASQVRFVYVSVGLNKYKISPKKHRLWYFCCKNFWIHTSRINCHGALPQVMTPWLDKIYLGRWCPQSNLQRKQHFQCNWPTWWKENDLMERNRMLSWTLQKCSLLQPMPYLQWFEHWHHVNFVYLSSICLSQKQCLYFGTAGTILGEIVQVLVGSCWWLGFRGCLAFGQIVRTQLLEELQRWKLQPSCCS